MVLVACFGFQFLGIAAGILYPEQRFLFVSFGLRDLSSFSTLSGIHVPSRMACSGQ